ncbi:hypothetical protein NKG05_11170 [Oerskovia sp. M15]
MPMTSRRDPVVLVAGLLTSILWIGTTVLSDWVTANFTYRVHSAIVRTVLPHPTGPVAGGAPVTGRTILAALLAGLVVVVVCYLATRRLPRRTGTWALFLATWFAVVVGGTAGALADAVADVTFPQPSNPMPQLLVSSLSGSYWGLADGWLVALLVVGTLALTNRTDRSSLPATRRARKPLRARAYPTVLVAGATAALVWAGVGAAGSWALWHSSLGPAALLLEVRDGAMVLGFAPRTELLAPAEVAYAVVIGLVVAGCAWLATRRLSPQAGRWTLVLAVWFAAIPGAVLVAAARLLAIYAAPPGGLHASTLSMVLPSMQGAVFWSLALGWVAGLLAVVVYRRTGGTTSADAAPEDAPAPEAHHEQGPDDAPGAPWTPAPNWPRPSPEGLGWAGQTTSGRCSLTDGPSRCSASRAQASSGRPGRSHSTASHATVRTWTSTSFPVQRAPSERSRAAISSAVQLSSASGIMTRRSRSSLAVPSLRAADPTTATPIARRTFSSMTTSWSSSATRRRSSRHGCSASKSASIAGQHRCSVLTR